MNRGGLGYLYKTGQLVLPLDFLEHLSITESGVLFGCYYPRAGSPEANPASTIEHEFMLTPVPFRFWSRCAHLLVRLRHQPGAMQALASVLADHKVAILHSECARSGHRYATWSLHVIFEFDEPDGSGPYDPDRSLYPRVDEARLALEATIERELRDTVLFEDPSDVDLRQAVRSWPHTALAYFNNHVEAAARKDPATAWRYESFRMHCRADGVLDPEETLKIYNVITNLDQSAAEPIVPAVLHATLDTGFFAVRVALIPNERLARFFEINIMHERAGEPDTCLGLIADIMRLLGDDYVPWRTYNYIERHSHSGSHGHIVLLVEDLSDDRFSDPGDYVSKARERLPVGKILGRGGYSRLKHVSFLPLTHESVRARLNEQSRVRGVPPYAVFISFHHEDRGLARQIYDMLKKEGLDAFMADAELSTGDQIPSVVRDAILNSQEMCVVCTRKGLKSSWVAAEMGVAWGVGMLIVPIALGVKASQLPVQLPNILGVQLSNTAAEQIRQLESYVQDVKLRRTGRGWEKGRAD